MQWKPEWNKFFAVNSCCFILRYKIKTNLQQAFNLPEMVFILGTLFYLENRGEAVLKYQIVQEEIKFDMFH